MNVSKVALVIIYNHQYNKNIEIIEKIYSNRFSNIFHLVPFYSGNQENVIAVYENSIYFQGYIAQGYSSFFSQEFDHYFFIADDLLLNPVINEKNYIEHLNLKQSTCYISDLITLHEATSRWPRVGDAFNYRINHPRVEAKDQIPNMENALELFSNFDLELKPIQHNLIWNPKKLFKDWVLAVIHDKKNFIRFSISFLRKKKHKLSYPMVGGYSDIFVVSAKNIKLFCHYCGVFSATDMHAELAIPTSMVLSAEAIVTEKNINLRGKALWSKEDHKILDIYMNDLDLLLKDFPEKHLYLHPIKLSQWKTP